MTAANISHVLEKFAEIHTHNRLPEVSNPRKRIVNSFRDGLSRELHSMFSCLGSRRAVIKEAVIINMSTSKIVGKTKAGMGS